MLVWITLTHLPTGVSTYTNQPFGFVSAAEGFIFLSALFTGRIYLRLAERDGYGTMQRKLSMRTLRLYGYHLLLLCFAFLVAVPIAASGTRPGLHNLLDFYFAGPHRAMIDGALLIYRPPLLDILPMYILFLALTPIVLTITRRIPWKYVVGASFAVWLLAQFGLKQAAYTAMAYRFDYHIPLKNMGAFDLWAWQFLWVLGLWFGVRWAKDQLPVVDWARRVTIPAAVIAVAVLTLRYAVFPNAVPPVASELFDKWHLGIVRMIDFAAVAALLIRFPAVLRSVTVRPLVLMGQASLQVFCAHVLFCFGGLTLMGSAPMLTGWRQSLLVAVTMAGMLGIAKVFAKSESGGPGPRTGEKKGPVLRGRPAPGAATRAIG